MPGYQHFPNCTCPWCCGGWGGGGSGSAERVNPHLKWQYSDDDFCSRTSCPICGAEVFFVRHNRGSVWFDHLGPPWPKHVCFDDDFHAERIRTKLAEKLRTDSQAFFGVIAEAHAINKWESARLSVKCSDGTTIHDNFFTTLDLNHLIGELVVVERKTEGEIRLHAISRRPFQPFLIRDYNTGFVPDKARTPDEIGRNFRLLSRTCDKMMAVLAERKKEWEETCNEAISILRNWHGRGMSNRTAAVQTDTQFDYLCQLLDRIENIAQLLKDTIGFIHTYLDLK